MKKISVVVPCFNEEENVVPLSEAVTKQFAQKLPGYDYELIFIDNDSSDGTRGLITMLCGKDRHIKAIFNAKNFGHIRSPFHGLLSAGGDCAVLMSADFQDPPELLPELVRRWEDGFSIVIGKKTRSRENRLMYFVRGMFYRFMKSASQTEHIEQFTGFGLYDRKFLDVLRKVDDPYPYMRGMVAELGFRRADVEFTQPERRAGKTKNNWATLYDMAMLGITSYTKVLPRLATVLGSIGTVLSVLGFMALAVAELAARGGFGAAVPAIVLSIFFVGSVQLFFIGILGEYLLNVNLRLMKRPLVVEERRINFDEPVKSEITQ